MNRPSGTGISPVCLCSHGRDARATRQVHGQNCWAGRERCRTQTAAPRIDTGCPSGRPSAKAAMCAKASAPPRSFTGNGGPEEIAQRAAQTGKEDAAPCTPLVSAGCNFDQVEAAPGPPTTCHPGPRTGWRSPSRCLTLVFSPTGRKRIAQRFNAGLGLRRGS